jgi:SAM-dependent methyltransferase
MKAVTQSVTVHDFHREQLESWLKENKHRMASPVYDLGCGRMRREWIGEEFGLEYFTVDQSWCKPDIEADLTDIWSVRRKSAGTVICTEVLEHVPRPRAVLAEIRRILSGWLFITSPFLWVWHGTANYPDYWRFTHQAWELLLKDFWDVNIEPVELASLEKFLDFAGSEAMFNSPAEVKFTTGYLCMGRT